MVDSSHGLYDQPEKQMVRERLLTNAVRRLTSERSSEVVVTEEYFRQLWSFCFREIIYKRTDIRIDEEAVEREWVGLHRRRLGSRSPEDLKVVFLAGPEPVGDLRVLLQAGVRLENIWAVESGRSEFESAVEQLRWTYPKVHIIDADLLEFFERNPEEFDIIYFDATASLPSRSGSRTQQVVESVFKQQKLADLGILISTFSLPDKGNAELYEQYVDILTSYFFACPFPPRKPDSASDSFEERGDSFFVQGMVEYKEIRAAIEADFDFYYQSFLTRWLTDWATTYQPFHRLLNYTSVRRKFYNEDVLYSGAAVDKLMDTDNKIIRSLVTHSGEFLGGADFILSPESFSHSWFVYWLREIAHLAWLRDFLVRTRPGEKFSLEDALHHAELSRKFLEGYFEVLSSKVITAVFEGQFFDHRMGLFCGVPMEHLTVELLAYQLGYPYFPNMGTVERYEYTAKKTKMFVDSITFDKCRYLFDWIPPVELFAEQFKDVGAQMVARVCMDAINKNMAWSFPDIFYGADLIGWGEREWSWGRLMRRRELIVGK